MLAIAGRGADTSAPSLTGVEREDSALDRWFRAEAESGRRIAALEDALLTGRFAGYAVHRLRFFFVRYLAAAFLHGVKFALLYALFAPDAFRTLLWLHALAGLAASFWWGGLEVMRDRIRLLLRAGRARRISVEIQAWMAVAALLAAIVIAAGAATAIAAGAGFGVVHGYALTVALGLALDLVTLTFHSGIYAIRRIYRPLATIVGVEAVGLAAVLAFHPWAGAWSLPLAMAAANLTSAAFVLHYTSRLYRFFDFEPFGWPSLGLLRSLVRRGVAFGAAGASYALLKLDAVLVLGLFRASPAEGEIGLFALFFAVAPTVQAGFDWAQLFYFDLKRLESGAFSNLRDRYERFVGRSSWAITGFFWLLASISGTVLFARSLGSLYLLMLPFFVSRSALAFAQIRSFAAGRHRELLASGLWLLGGILVLRLTVADERIRLAVVPFLAIAALLSLGRSKARHPAAAGEVRALLVWLREVAVRDAPTRVRAARLAWERRSPSSGDELAAPPIERQMAERLARRLRANGSVAMAFGGTIVWCEDGTTRRSPSKAWLLGLGRGLVESLAETGIELDGRRAIARAQSLGILPVIVDRGTAGHADESAMIVEFRKRFPEGLVHEVDAPASSSFARLDARDRRAVYVEAARFARDLDTRRTRLPFEVTAYCAGSDLRLVFLVERNASRRSRAEWVERVRRANLRAALAS